MADNDEKKDEGAGDGAQVPDIFEGMEGDESDTPTPAGGAPAKARRARKGTAGGDMPRHEIVKTARKIAEEYYDQDLVLTVRQLYYQFVARGLLGSGQQVYKRIVAALADARMEGMFPMHLIEDRGRDIGEGDATLCENDIARGMLSGKSIIGNLPSTVLRVSRWHRQPNFVSVFVEKEALAGVFEAPCKELGVSLFPCKGYPSVSSLYAWAQMYRAARTPGLRSGKDGWAHAGMRGREAVILYFGDHDPDGIEIPESIARSFKTMERNGVVPPLGEIDIRRVALNMDQIERYNPPPFDAKETSARYASYLTKHNTTDAWELDALDPAVLQTLIRENVEGLFDSDIFEENKAEIREKRQELRRRMKADGWFADAIDGEDEDDDEE